MTINVFVSTKETQGARSNDFSWVPEGEVLKLPAFQCDRGYADDSCGCHRSLVGIECSTSTTTAKVAEIEGNLFDLMALIQQSYVKEGWAEFMKPKELGDIVEQEARELERCAANWPIGTIVEFRENAFAVRAFPGEQVKLQEKKGKRS